MHTHSAYAADTYSHVSGLIQVNIPIQPCNRVISDAEIGLGIHATPCLYPDISAHLSSYLNRRHSFT